MDGLTRGITRHKKLVIAIFLVATVISAVLILGVSVNYDLTDYLPEDSESTIALDLMYEEFGSGVPNTRVMVRNLTLTGAVETKAKIAQAPGVTGVMWLDDTQDYWGVQFDLYLPEGMELDDEGGFSPFELSTERFPHSSRGGQITFKHGVDYTQFESRWYRILISPNDVESFITGREGELLKIYYPTSDDLQPGIHPILVRGALFVVTGVYGVEPPNSASYCTVGTSFQAVPWV